jgi:hypothetical protein
MLLPIFLLMLVLVRILGLRFSFPRKLTTVN